MSNPAAVGVIGIGLLGQAFVHRLRSAGFDVVGFDVDAGKNARLIELGSQVASSVADLARRCDPLVLAVFSTGQVEAVVENELLPALGQGSGKIVLCASTCDPERIAALGQRAATRGLRLLETPVSGASGRCRGWSSSRRSSTAKPDNFLSKSGCARLSRGRRRRRRRRVHARLRDRCVGKFLYC